MWMGLRSPEAAAYSRMRRRSTDSTASGGGAGPNRRGGTARFVGQAGALLLEECRGLHRDNLCADGEFASHVHQQTQVLSQVLRVGGDGQRLVVDTDPRSRSICC